MRQTRYNILFIAFCALALAGCFDGGYAPVIALGVAPQAAPKSYHVKRGDTLYSIAWAYGLDYRRVARINHLDSSYSIWPGQDLTLKSRNKWQQKREAQKNRYKSKTAKHTYAHLNLNWHWPAKGSIIQIFKPGWAGNAGLDIGGSIGEVVRAAAPGRVVYSGHGVRGYGNLIIIKHSDDFLSAYAFNQKNLVRVGSHVRQGQRIATMGKNSQGKAALHFEIRQNGKPLDPIRLLG